MKTTDSSAQVGMGPQENHFELHVGILSRASPEAPRPWGCQMWFHETMPVPLKRWLPVTWTFSPGQCPSLQHSQAISSRTLSDHTEELLKILSGSTEFQLHRKGLRIWTTPELLQTTPGTGCPLSPASAGATYATGASGDITART